MKPLFVYADAGSFTLEPLFQEIALQSSDQTKQFNIALSNHTDTDASFAVSVVDFGTLDESGGVAFLGGGSDFETRYGLASWMKVGEQSFTVPAHGMEHVLVTIENRESLSPGGHYGAVLFQIQGDPISGESSPSVAFRPSFASLVFVKKTGGEKEQLEYRGEVRTEKNIFGIRTKSVIRFQNSGNVHLVPRGRVSVRDMFGRVVRSGVINESSGRMLPESFREFPVTLMPRSRAWLPGVYRTTIEWRYDGKDDMTAETVTSTIPIGLHLLWCAALVCMVGIVWKLRRMIIDKKHLK